MPALQPIVDSLEKIPEALRSFYEPKDGKFQLLLDGAEDVSGLRSALEKERTGRSTIEKELKAIRDKLGDLDPDKAREALKRLTELEDRKLIEEGKEEEFIAARTKRMREDHENQIAGFNKQLENAKRENATLNERLSSVLIDSAIRDAAIKAGVRKSALPDVVLRGKQIYRLEEGKPTPKNGDQIIYGKNPNEPMTIDEWIGSLTKDADHLFEPSSGAGANPARTTGQGGAVTISREQARDPQQYRAAKERADKAGVEVQIQQQSA